MAMASTSSLLNFLSPLFPSTTTTSTTTNTPKFPPQPNSSSTLLSITLSSSLTQQQIKPISAKNDEHLCQGDVMAVVCPPLAYSNTLFFNSSYNVQILIDDNEPEERLLNRFRREVMKAGVIQECKRRRRFENTHDKEKRKSREAVKRNSRSRRGPPPRFQNRDEPTKVEKKDDDDDGDNWEMPQGCQVSLYLSGVAHARLGYLVEFLSHAVTIGFMAGAAIVISLQQLKGLLGSKNFTRETDIISVMHSVASAAHHGWDWRTIVIGVSFLVFLLVGKYIGKGNKRLFWVAAIAPLVSVTLATFFVYITHANKHGVQIVGHIPKGINPLSIDELYFSGANLTKGFKIGAVVGIIVLTEALAIGRTFAEMRGYELDGNQEMVALGVTNIICSITSCYVVSGGFGRSAVNYMAGCQTAVSNIVMAPIALFTLQLITPLFNYIPNAILASIVISAVLGIIDIKEIVQIWKIDKFDFVACVGAFLGVIFNSFEIGLLIAVCLSVGKIMFRVTRPQTALLGKIPGSTEYKNIQQFSEATLVPGVLIVKVDTSIYFANSNYITDKFMKWLKEEEDKVAERNMQKIKYLIIDMSAVADMDTSGTHAIEKLYRCLQKKNVKLVIGSPGQLVVDKLHASGLMTLREDSVLASLTEAVHMCSSTTIQ